jgi:arsenate reductase-like glutaredoxin family protein
MIRRLQHISETKKGLKSPFLRQDNSLIQGFEDESYRQTIALRLVLQF